MLSIIVWFFSLIAFVMAYFSWEMIESKEHILTRIVLVINVVLSLVAMAQEADAAGILLMFLTAVANLALFIKMQLQA